MYEFSSLEEALEKVPPNVGFNVEIKCPSAEECSSLGIFRPDNFNEYCDAILLQLVNSIGVHSDRLILISSFDPDICIVVSQKQNLFPVLFLTDGGLVPSSRDSRRNSLRNAYQFAKSTKLDGIVCDSTVLVDSPKLIEFIRSEGLLLFSYGERNNNLEAASKQIRWGISGVIVDGIGTMAKGLIMTK